VRDETEAMTPRGDLEWVSIPRLVDASSEAFGDADAIIDGDVRLTFRELAVEMRHSARAAIAAGLAPGDRAAIWAENRVEWVVAALGVQAAGGVIVPVSTRFKGDEAAWVLRRSGARLLFTVGEFLGVDYVAMLRGSGEAVPDLEEIIVLGGGPADTTSWPEHLARGDRVPAADAEARLLAVQSDDVADILFTSGTTGRPKGAMTTHGQNLRVFEVYTRALGLRAGDRYLVVNPFFHSFGYKAGWLSSIMRGATVYPWPVFDVDAVLDVIERERISVLPGPPTLLQEVLDAPSRDDHDLSSLRLTITGSASVPVSLIRRLRAEMSFETVLTGYGLTETSAVVSVSRHDDDPERTAAWAGQPVADTEVKVVDDEGRDVPTGEQGELLVRGYNVMHGYWDDPAGTAATIDGDGWLHTGDIGIVDEQGYVKVTDRKKDMFIVGGFNAYPAEIESLLLTNPDVAQVAVVGAPDDQLGEVGVAFVVPIPGAAPRPDDIVAWSREHMANFKVPRAVEIVEALPLNASGKVVKDPLRERAAALRQEIAQLAP
jgi:HIP---CoA ligase